MASPNDQACGECRFFLPDGPLIGKCQRHPPTIHWRKDPLGNEEELLSLWPSVDETDWCGEYEEERGPD